MKFLFTFFLGLSTYKNENGFLVALQVVFGVRILNKCLSCLYVAILYAEGERFGMSDLL